jgi:hypothetical protein
VIERDNQAGPDATIKKIYTFSTHALKPQPQGETFPVLSKTFVRDLIPDLTADHGLVIEIFIEEGRESIVSCQGFCRTVGV